MLVEPPRKGVSNGSVGSWLTGERALMGDGFPLVCDCFQVVLAYEVLCYVSVQVSILIFILF